MVFKDFGELSDAWRDLREVVRSGFLGATGVKCSTLRYNPLRRGAGPTTVGRIAIYTKENDVMDVGMKLIRLPCVQQMIKYKTRSATKAMQNTPVTQSVGSDTLYWNEGKPSSERGQGCFQKKISFKYDSSRDQWKINVVDGASQYASEKITGHWIISSNFDKTSKLNISKMWHTWKPKIESGDIPAVKMVCPGPKREAKILVFTSEEHMDAVDKSLKSLLKSDITHANPDQDPLSVTEVSQLSCPGHSYSADYINQTYGQWMVFKDYSEISDAWRNLLEVVRSGFLGATGTCCSTLKYDPLYCGAGPTTVGRIAIFTKEDDIMDVGMKLIRLPCVQQIIKYKTLSATRAMKFRHIVPPNQPVASDTLYWNEGKPSRERAPRCLCFQKYTSFKYDSSRDLWKINVVDGASQYASEKVNGYWNVSSNFAETSELNISELWHTWKSKIEGGDIPAVKMECPGPKRVPRIHVFTSEEHMDAVGKSLISFLRSDITHSNISRRRKDNKTLYWNAGKPDYTKARI